MNEKRPQIEPGGFSEVGSGQTGGLSIPTVTPAVSTGGEGLQGVIGAAQAAAPVPTISGGDAAPALLPADGAMTGITAWQNNKKITGLWSINQNRNSWLHVEGVGWKKLANNSDSAVVALTMLGAHAREKGTNVNYREESDGMIREIYAW